uniref:DDE_Tnp_IS1595 domain-containing protein n=1 Tax=Globodera pallida TaxID=36090 RepID=A0A183BKY7_GLOPA
MDELQNFTMWNLHQKLALEDDEFDEWLTELGLLHAKRTCPACEMGTIEQWKRELEIGSEHTVCDWRNFMRDVCAEWFIRNPTRIGGPGVVCEIDETMAVRRKYERGRLVANDIWLFGGTERGHPERCFIVPVERRNAATLLPLITQFIEPGSIVHSDMWRAYGGIPQLPYGYQHMTVNHTQNFIDPGTGAHTQSIESLWQRVLPCAVFGQLNLLVTFFIVVSFLRIRTLLDERNQLESHTFGFIHA